ncbi:MAG: hypothetical protein ACFFG0_10055 [Candidatus Thorarchaeota archaeon]
MKEDLPQHIGKREWKLFGPLLPLEVNENLIEINKDFDAQSQVLPYETVMNLID